MQLFRTYKLDTILSQVVKSSSKHRKGRGPEFESQWRQICEEYSIMM